MISINPELKKHAEENILPQYEKNDKGHSREHIDYVISRCLKFARQFENINVDMLFAAAAFHDIAHHIDKKNHEKLSAENFYSDKKMKEIFTEKQRQTIREAIEDHRASLDREPRNDYGKILSSADRSTDVDEFLRRTHAYTLRHFPGCSDEEAVKRAYVHTYEKYGNSGYAKNYVNDEEYNSFRNEISFILSDEKIFENKYKEVICFYEK